MSKDPFDILGLPRIFSLDLQDLNKKYFERQRKYHPDGRLAPESSDPLNAADINWSYSILKNPLMRARVLLDMAGEIMPLYSPQLLMQSMEDRETLEGLESLEELESFEGQKKAFFDQGIMDLEKAFSNDDVAHAKNLTLELIYVDKLLQEIKKRKL